QNILFDYRNWNTLAFRGRLMSLLAPARGMPTLSAKDGFSRPSLKPVPASSSNASKHASSAQGSKEACPSSTSLRGLIEAFPPVGVSRIPVAGLGFHSQRVVLTIQFIQVNFIGAKTDSSNHNIYMILSVR